MLQTEKKLLQEEKSTERERLFAHLTIVMLFAALGAFTVPKVKLIPMDSSIFLILKYGIALGIICSIGNLVFYYSYLIRKISREEYITIERHYQEMGIMSRIFYGGFVEEIMFRWGILSFLLWLLQLMFGDENLFSIFMAILISSLLFALVHLPSVKMSFEKPGKSIYAYTILGNMWVGFLTSLAFLKAGIFAAIIVHVLFHLLWWPVQRLQWKKVIGVE